MGNRALWPSTTGIYAVSVYLANGTDDAVYISFVGIDEAVAAAGSLVAQWSGSRDADAGAVIGTYGAGR